VTQNSSPQSSFQGSNGIIGAIGDGNFVVQNIYLPPGKPAPHMLMRDDPDFTGRTLQIEQIQAIVEDGKIATINGMGGVGKSTLAIHVAKKLESQFPDAQLYVNLQGQTALALKPESVLILFLRALTGKDESQLPTDLDGLAAQYRSELSQKRAIVVLDNAASVKQIKPLLPGTSNCAVIVTSRSPLGSLQGSTPMELKAMLPEEGKTYLARQLGQSRVQAEEMAVQEIVELCGALPLALAISAGALKISQLFTIDLQRLLIIRKPLI
jgi:predicted ATPase